jgi:hypothetical protein
VEYKRVFQSLQHEMLQFCDHSVMARFLGKRAEVQKLSKTKQTAVLFYQLKNKENWLETKQTEKVSNYRNYRFFQSFR